MTISDEIRAIREKYTPKDLVLKPSSYCRNEYARSLGQCQLCGICGRVFENNELVQEASETQDYIKNGIDTRPVFIQLEEVFNKKGQNDGKDLG